VRIVVGFPPGGATDILARMLAPGLSTYFGQQFVIDNRPGAAGSIAAEIVSRSPPDGCTLLAVPAAFASSVSMYPKLAYDPLRDFAPITQIATVHYVLVAHPAVPAKTAGELVALVKREPGQITFASAGNGSASHLAMELLRTTATLNILHVPHRGMGPAVIDLLGGQVDALMATLPTTVPHIRSGRLRALAVASLKRVTPLPEVPTLDESGFPGYEATAWNGLLAPAGTSYDVITRLNVAAAQILTSREMKERLAAQGTQVIADTPDQFAVYLRSEVVKWAKVVKMSGAKID
jgi:tripartite-type tricarboxylate transporter receptor subunit TctC